MKKFFKILLWVVIAVIFVGTFVYLYQNSKDVPQVYEVVEPTTGNIERSTVLTGKIEPRDEIAIKPQISGIITEINVEAGQMVKAGDVIAHIKVIPEASALSSAASRVESAKVSLSDAKAKYERAKALYEKKLVSKEEFETAETTYRQAQRELEAANDAVMIVRQGVSKHNAAEANTMVRATITGLVLDVPVKVGTSVIQANTFNDGTTIATIADMKSLIFKGKVDETDVGNLAVGMPMEITVGAMPEVHPTAVLEYISPKSVEESGANTFEIKGALSVPDDVELRSGYSANATVILSRVENALRVPENVIEYEGDSTFVYVLTSAKDAMPQTFERRAVTTGASDGINIQIKEGIDSTAVLRSQLQQSPKM